MALTLFQKIISREIPADIVWESDDVLVFKDINPQAPVRLLAIPKKKHVRLAEVPDSEALLLGDLLTAAKQAAHQCGLTESGYRIVINNGTDGGKSC